MALSCALVEFETPSQGAKVFNTHVMAAMWLVLMFTFIAAANSGAADALRVLDSKTYHLGTPDARNGSIARSRTLSRSRSTLRLRE
jgi:hypothetical protein